MIRPMRRITFLLLVFVVYYKVAAQISERYIKPDTFSLSNSAIYLDNHIFLDVAKGAYFDIHQESIWLFKLNLQLETIDSVSLSALFPTTGINRLTVTYLASFANDTIILCLQKTDTLNNCLTTEAIVAFFDKNLNLLDSALISSSIDQRPYFILRLRVIEQKKMLISGHLYPYCQTSIKDGFVAELDSTLTIVKEGRVLNSQLLNSSKGSIYDIWKVSNNYIGLFEGLTWTNHLAVFNDSMQLQSIQNLSGPGMTLTGTNQFIESSGSIPLVYTLGMFPKWGPPGPWADEYRYLALITLNTNYGFSRLDTFMYTSDNYLPDEYYIPKVSKQSISRQLSDSVLFFSNDVLPLIAYYSSKPSTNSYIHNVNTNTMTSNWHKVYNNGYTFMSQQILSLPGNKTLLMFNEYNWDKYPYENLATHLIIIDGQGNPIGIPEEEQFSEVPTLYPNPVAAGGVLQLSGLREGKTYQYYLNSTSGHTVQQGTLTTEHSIHLNNLPAGVYTLSITNKYGWGWATKVVVQ